MLMSYYRLPFCLCAWLFWFCFVPIRRDPHSFEAVGDSQTHTAHWQAWDKQEQATSEEKVFDIFSRILPVDIRLHSNLVHTIHSKSIPQSKFAVRPSIDPSQPRMTYLTPFTMSMHVIYLAGTFHRNVMVSQRFRFFKFEVKILFSHAPLCCV